jgi:hypothetical protein
VRRLCDRMAPDRPPGLRIAATLQQMQRTVAAMERKRPQPAGRHLIRSWEADA